MADPLIEAWLQARAAAMLARRDAQLALVAAAWAPLPDNLRPAEASDVFVGALLWYPAARRDFPLEVLGPPSEANRVEAMAWHRVEEVLRPSDDWKAFLAEDGTRRGLRGAFVEVHHG